MRLYVFLFLAVAALQCQAATLPDKILLETIEKTQNSETDLKLIKDDKEEPVQNNASEEELIQPVNTVPEIGNELRKIPVKVVPEVKPSLKSDTEKDAENEIKDEKIEKPQDPIKPEAEKVEQPQDPIKPEVQKPEDDKKEEKPTSDISDFDDEVEEPGTPIEESNLSINFLTEALSSAHQSIQLTVDTFAKAFQNWIRDQSALLPSEEQIKVIIDINIKKINETLRGYFSPAQAAKLVEADASDSTNQVEVVESDLKKLEKDFENDVKSVLRADNNTSGCSGSNTPAGCSGSGSGSGSGNGGPVVIQNLQQLIQQGFSNITSSFTSLFNQGSGDNSTNNLFVLFGQNIGSFFNPQPSNSSAQSDEGAPSRPNIFQSIQNIFRPPFQQNQGNQQPQADQAQPNRPIINAIQGNPIVQSISGVFNRNPTKPAAPAKPEAAKPEAAKPEAAKPEPEKPADEGSNVVPEPSADPVDEKVKPEPTAEYHPGGPIQQAIQKNPIVQGITGAVQKIQQTYQNPEKPRKVGHLVHHIHGIHHHGTHGGQGSGDKFSSNVDHIDSADVAGHRSGGSTSRSTSGEQSEATEQSGDKKPDCEKKEAIPKKDTIPKEDKITLDEETIKVEQKTE